MSNQNIPTYQAYGANAWAKDQEKVQQKLATAYNTNQINSRTTVFVSQTALGNNQSFNAKITVPFVPDEMIVKNITYYQSAGAGTIWFVKSSLIAQDVLGCFGSSGAGWQPTSTGEQSTFKLQRLINGTYQFAIVDNLNGTTPAIVPDATGSIAISLEFIKYDV